MKIFDLHADIGYDIYHKYYEGIRNRLNDVHEFKLKQGLIEAVNIACYFDGKASYEEMLDEIRIVRKEIIEANSFKLIEAINDMVGVDHKQIIAFLSIEGMGSIHYNEAVKISKLYKLGIRIGSLCWNETNDLASGNKNNLVGLTSKGINAIKKMNELGMIIDVSHANEKTFYDILNNSKRSVIATHSNAYTLCNNARNLKDEQLKLIAANNGIVGVVACKAFVSDILNEQDIEHYVNHIRYISNLIGIDHVCLGFDYMDNCYEDHLMINSLSDASKSQLVITELINQGFSDLDIKKVCYDNAYKFFLRELSPHTTLL
ncbi:MAG: membrane dipeptidase [Erysipelotrichaceae bacterium]